MSRYTFELSDVAEKELEDLTKTLGTSRADVLGRSLTLFKHAVEADKVVLQRKKGDGDETEEQEVLLK